MRRWRRITRRIGLKMSDEIQRFFDLLAAIPAGNWAAICEEDVRILAHGPDAQEVYEGTKHLHPLPLILRKPEHMRPIFF